MNEKQIVKVIVAKIKRGFTKPPLSKVTAAELLHMADVYQQTASQLRRMIPNINVETDTNELDKALGAGTAMKLFGYLDGATAILQRASQAVRAKAGRM